MDFFLQLLLTGLMVGGVYALIALGFVLIYKSSGVFNLAQGELLLLGAFVCWSLLDWGIPAWLSILLTFAVGAMIGLIIERLALRPLIGQPIYAIVMVTIALSLILQGIVTGVWTGSLRLYPEFLPSGAIHIGGVILSQQHLYTFGIAVLAFIGFSLFFMFTKSGLAMRAVAEDNQMARASGINVKTIFATTWAIAALFAAVGGILLGSISGVSLGLGVSGLKILPVVLLGGLNSIPGAMIGGLIVGMVEIIAAGYLDQYVGGGFQEIAPFVILVIILFFRPYGLFGLKEIERI